MVNSSTRQAEGAFATSMAKVRRKAKTKGNRADQFLFIVAGPTFKI